MQRLTVHYNISTKQTSISEEVGPYYEDKQLVGIFWSAPEYDRQSWIFRKCVV